MADWEPFWTDEVTIENGGKYPLLLNRFHDHLEEHLIKGIVSVTDRLRYISYCCWAIGDIEHTLHCEKYYEFEEAFRRREGALAIGTYLLQPVTAIGNYTIYGRDVMRGKVEDVYEEYDTSFRILPSNPLGAYGQYYKGTIQNWGLTYIDDNGIIRLTDSGDELYTIMEKVYQKNKYYSSYKGNRSVPGKILMSWAEINQYDNMRDNRHQEERDFYKNILFHLDQEKTNDFRRDTLTIYLECIIEAEKNNRTFNDQLISNTVYYQKYVNDDNKVYKFTVSPFLEEASFYWLIYELHVYFRWWISEYLRYFLRLIATRGEGFTIDEIIKMVNKSVFNQTIAEYLGVYDNYHDMIFSILMSKITSFKSSNERLLEDEISYNEASNFSQVSASLLMIISLLYQKYSEIEDDYRFHYIRIHLSEDYWFKDIYDIMNILKEKTISEVLYLLLFRFVIQKHDLALYEKHDLRRCWFTRAGDRYQHQADSTSIWRPAKHTNICNFLFDMGLIEVKEKTFVITEEGNILYKELRENYYEE